MMGKSLEMSRDFFIGKVLDLKNKIIKGSSQYQD